MKSIWHDTEPVPAQSKRLEGGLNVDVLIIGGGMAGILCARLLKESGVNSVILEARRIGSGITGNTTGKLTSQHGLIYADLIQRFGEEKARLYYEANENALERYRKLAGLYECDFEEKPAFTFSVNRSGKLEREAKAYEKLGIKYGFEKNPPLPFKTAGALRFDSQAQIHPLKFLSALSRDLDIYENSQALKIEDGRVDTEHGHIKASHIVIATHFPMVNIKGLYFLKLYQHRSYVLALENGPQLDGMYIDEHKDGTSFRNYRNYLFLGGGDHRTGKKGGGYDELRRIANEAYPNAAPRYSWAAQDCISLDGIPYAGVYKWNGAKLYAATGFNKWGMTGSMAAAITLSDLIVSGKSMYSEIFSPDRRILRASLFSNFAHAAGGLLSFGKRCTHMGCALHRNSAEGSWDCSCHGSRYNSCGQVIDNPAIGSIKP